MVGGSGVRDQLVQGSWTPEYLVALWRHHPRGSSDELRLKIGEEKAYVRARSYKTFAAYAVKKFRQKTGLRFGRGHCIMKPYI